MHDTRPLSRSGSYTTSYMCKIILSTCVTRGLRLLSPDTTCTVEGDGYQYWVEDHAKEPSLVESKQ